MSNAFNGWSSWETWNLNNWIQNDEDSYNFWRQQAVELDVQSLADELEQAHYEPMDNMPPSWHKDALGQALSRVNWEEVADALKE